MVADTIMILAFQSSKRFRLSVQFESPALEDCAAASMAFSEDFRSVDTCQECSVRHFHSRYNLKLKSSILCLLLLNHILAFS